MYLLFLEGDNESRRSAQQLKELQTDIDRQAQAYQTLRNSSLALLGSLTPEDALMLQLRGDEVERRWQVTFYFLYYLFQFYGFNSIHSLFILSTLVN